MHMTKIPCIDARGIEHLFNDDEFVERPSVYGICIQNDKILLTKDIWSHKWGIPGGGIDSGETPENALEREFLEETAITISIGNKAVLTDVTYFLGDGENKPWKTLRSVYLVTPTGGHLQNNGTPGELLEAKYIQIEEAKDFLRMSKNNKAIADLIENII